MDRPPSPRSSCSALVAVIALLSGCTDLAERTASAATLEDAPRATAPDLAAPDPDRAITVPATDVAPAPDPSPESCPAGMVLVEGEYCPVVRESCRKWMEDPNKFSYARCAEYGPSECVAPREHRRFCIDRDEWKAQGEQLPAVDQSWTNAKATCESAGKRLCLETEWQFACEGEELRPYPYGWVRDSAACNFDRTDLYLPDGSLRDLREASGARSGCESPFGVRDMVGNVDEWTVRDGTTWGPYRSAMKGGWWLAGRNRCRATTTAHDEHYHGPQAGFRCCADTNL